MSHRQSVVIVTMLILISSLHAGAFEVVEDEIFFDDPPLVEFENFTGIPDRIDSAEQILDIGRYLGEARELGVSERTYAGRYRLVRAVNPQEPVGLDADIIFLLSDARVDHIENLRRIIAGYLEQTYRYNASDAALLARFVTIYNAVHRRDMNFFRDRYKQVVLEYLTPQGAGLPLSYREWPGASQIVIPIRDPDATERLGVISPTEIIDDMVMEDLRSRRDMGLEDRRDMIDFLERLIIEEEQEIIEERERIAEERERIAEEREHVDEERERIAEEREHIDDDLQASDDPVDESDPVDDAEPQLIDDLEEREQELIEREEQLAEREQEVEELREEVAHMREETADDQDTMLEDADLQEVVPAAERVDLVTLLVISQTSPVVQSQLVRAEPDTGRIVVRSTETALLGRKVISGADGIIGIVANTGGGAVLMQFNVDTLDPVRESDVELHPSSILESAGGGGVYAVANDNGRAYIARFSSELQENARSAVSVRPHTPITLIGNRLYVQASNNSIVLLDPETLEQIE